MTRCLLILLALFGWIYASAQQTYTQTLRGTIADKDSKAPLFGATVVILGSDPVKGAATDEQGRFRITEVPVGRHTIKVSYIGYNELVIPNVIVNSGKETVLSLEMTESVVAKQEVVITSERSKEKANNEMAVVSARTFSTDEAQRYAGALGDPARMAANFAGVSAPNDARNDVIIRGNSPQGLLWRVEGVDIPNPNHFSSQGTTGGPVSILNNNTLRNSDFFTGAWPAEYGNAISGVFDLRLRNGNNEKYEFMGQVGFNGFEGLAEGPISKKKGSSYLATYRYSALGFFQALGINLGPGGTPKYQDFTFKLNFPSVKGVAVEVFGIGGKSDIELLDSKRKDENLSYGQNMRDVYFGSDMGVVGMSFTKAVRKHAFLKAIFAQTYENHRVNVDSIGRDADNNNKPYDFFNDRSAAFRTTAHVLYNQKFDARNTLRTGFIATRLGYDILQENYENWPPGAGYWRKFTDDQGSAFLGQAYVHWKHDFTEKLSLLPGIHYERFFYNNTQSIEPRAGLRYALTRKQSLNLGYGLHGQIQPLMIYFYRTQGAPTQVPILTNKDLGFTKSHHLVLGYDHLLMENVRLKAETYFQYLFEVPVQRHPDAPKGSPWSMANQGADFGVDLASYLVNEGEGRNYGVELTLEKFFSKNYFFLLTGSLFNSEYLASDGIWRSTAFNSNYVLNALAGGDIKLGRNSVLTLSGKATTAGGRRYTPIDTAASRMAGTAILDGSQAFSQQFPAYFRADARVGFKLNGKKITQEWAIDVQNVTNHKNILSQVYDPKANVVRDEYQLGIFPVAMYRIQF